MDSIINYGELIKDLDRKYAIEPEIIKYDEYSTKELMNQEFEAFGMYLSHNPIVELKEKNIDAEIINAYRDRFVFIDQDSDICHNIRCVLCKHNLFMRPAGNRYLTVGNMPYKADDEVALSIIENGRLNIISPCSHSGLLNIITSCCESTGVSRVNAFVGGLHLLDEEVSADNVPLLAETLHSTYSGIKLITGHCTGALAKETFTRIMQGNCKVMNTGFSIDV